MASTGNLQTTINFTAPLLRYQPLTIGGMEPALSYANMVLQTILGPPFKWPWNRAVASFTCVAENPTQDYATLVADFGFIESATVTDPGSGKHIELSVKGSLQRDVSQSRPAHIAAQIDNNSGVITFRLSPSPDVDYLVDVTYQKAAPTITSPASLWSPIPDKMLYVPNWGFMAMASLLTNDVRAIQFNQRFMAHLIGAQGGLDELERNIFLANWLQVTAATQTSQLSVQQRMAARQL